MNIRIDKPWHTHHVVVLCLGFLVVGIILGYIFFYTPIEEQPTIKPNFNNNRNCVQLGGDIYE